MSVVLTLPLESDATPSLQNRYEIINQDAIEKPWSVSYRDKQTFDMVLSEVSKEAKPCDLVLANMGLAGSSFSRVVHTLRHASWISSINLSKNRLADSSLHQLSRIVYALPNLSSLNLATNLFTHEGVHALLLPPQPPISTRVYTTLKELVLSNNTLSKFEPSKLATFLETCTTLKHLGLARCNLPAAFYGTPSLINALRRRPFNMLELGPSLRLGEEEIDIDVAVAVEGPPFIAATLLPSLTSLNLSCINESSFMTSSLLQLSELYARDIVARDIVPQSTGLALTWLDLSCAPLTSQNCKNLSSVLARSALTSLNLNSCGIKAKDFDFLLSGFDANNTLVTLNVGGNQFGKDTTLCTKFIRSLSNKPLQELVVCFCGLEVGFVLLM